MEKTKSKEQGSIRQAKEFVYSGYKFEPAKEQASFHYQIVFADGEKKDFTERVVLPQAPRQDNIPAALLEELLSGVHLMLGVSYYKLYCPPEIKLNRPLKSYQAAFWDTVYSQGLGEFYYRNKLDPDIFPGFPHEESAEPAPVFELPRGERVLVGIGGGKDSIVTMELLKKAGFKITGFVVETQQSSPGVTSIIERAKIDSLMVRRWLDEQLFEDHPDRYGGHIPISGVYAWLGLLMAVLYGWRYVVVGNEYSSNFGNLVYKGKAINHQWSKTEEFEQLLQSYIRLTTPDVAYFSLLRPFYEIRVVEMFTKYKKWLPYFSSCNRNFTIRREGGVRWCGRCAKCAFMFVLLSAFLTKKKLVKIFGKNLYEEAELLPTFKDLLGVGNIKPFDCVGTFEESQAALFLAREEFGNDLVVKALLPTVKNPQALIKKVWRAQAAPTVPTKFRFLGMKNALILGYGKEGRVTERYLKQYHADLRLGIADQKDGPHYLAAQKNFDMALRTPGVAKGKVKIQYTTATNVFFSQVKQVTIGVTGTKGKSTTAALINDMIKAGGKRGHLLGNIGRPALEALLRPVNAADIFVVELSSYQLDDIEASPHIAVVLNLWPDHMNYHGGVEEYYRAKKNIINWQRSTDVFVYNPSDKKLLEWAREARAKTVPFAPDIPLPANDIPLIGEHNRENVRAAVAVARLLNIEDAAIAKAIANFKPLPHRLEPVGMEGGITFYDDAVSTTPESTIQAILALKNIGTIFLGGEDRGYDFSELEEVVRAHHIRNVALFPDSGARIFRSRQGFNILETSDMTEAVKFAFDHTPPGSICLLSTASPSYSLWKNFEEQGQQFQAAIKRIVKKPRGRRHI